MNYSHKNKITFLCLLAFSLTISTIHAAEKEKINKGIFLVATDKLSNSSFKKAVILITHNSIRATTGIAINRPSSMPLYSAFPKIKQFKKYQGKLYLGGPVRANNLFLLINTDSPQTGMYRIADGLYFTRGLEMLLNNLDVYNSEHRVRAYAGYAGWGPGQLQNEIDRGDWTIVRTDPSVVFESDREGLWERLAEKKTTGRWI